MTIRIAAVSFLAALALASSVAADDAKSVEEIAIEKASTPADHTALANDFHARAEGARAEAKKHDSMARTYMPSGQSKMSWGTVQARQKMAEHCKRISQQNTAIANDYDELAKLHESEAK
jgi:hypothetical protein